MPKRVLFLALTVAIFVSVCSAQAQLPLLSNVFDSNMVLQANMNSSIWGWTSLPSSKVSVTFSRVGVPFLSLATLSTNHKWTVSFNLPVSNVPALITVVDLASNQQVQIDNVVFGLVYICGGQSNMVMSVSGAFNASTEIPQADNYPDIRVFTAGQGTNSTTPLPVFRTVEQSWRVASSESIGGTPWTYFSATCWFFGRELYDRMKVPIGLMSINWGGTYIQTWMSSDAITACSDSEPPRNAPNRPSMLYNAMLTPVFGVSVSGILWYQGESNVGGAPQYECLFPTMIADWRYRQMPWAQFASPAYEIPFFFVQLAAYISGVNTQNRFNLPALRSAQTAALTLPSVSGVTAIDAGDLTSNLGNIHPRNKQILGKRLASAVFRGMTANEWGIEGPRSPSVVRRAPGNSNDLTLLVTFSTTYPLVLESATCPSTIDPILCSAFSIMGSDGKWYDGQYQLHNAQSGTVLVQPIGMPAGVQPTRLRYAYSAWPLVVIYDTKHSPAWPFDLPVF